MLTQRRLRQAEWLIALGMLILALQPLQWLWQTWVGDVYQSDGAYIALLVLGLLWWRFSLADNRRLPQHLSQHRFAVFLLLLSSLVRLTAQVLGINTLGAMALVVDVYALGLLFNIDRGQRGLSAFWLAVLFAFSLPLERLFQRLIGYGLQHISADGACQLLQLGSTPVVCDGVNILLAGQEVLVDLPCSGTRGLLQLLVLFGALAVLLRPSWRQALVGLGLTLVAAWLSNVIRIIILAQGIAHAEAWQIDVMQAPYHDLIGLLALLLGLMPIFFWAKQIPKPEHKAQNPIHQHNISATQARQWQFASLLFVCITSTIVFLPAQPIDVARPMLIQDAKLPLAIDRYVAKHQPLTTYEHAFFTQYGGAAMKSEYGAFGLLKVSTSAPLRHLHEPEVCLRGAGHEVQYLRMSQYQGIPTAFYHSTDPDGNQWQIRVTFVADDGRMSSNISEVIWHWLQQRSVTWSMLQRIAPADVPAAEFDAWDLAVRRALELTPLN